MAPISCSKPPSPYTSRFRIRLVFASHSAGLTSSLKAKGPGYVSDNSDMECNPLGRGGSLDMPRVILMLRVTNDMNPSVRTAQPEPMVCINFLVVIGITTTARDAAEETIPTTKPLFFSNYVLGRANEGIGTNPVQGQRRYPVQGGPANTA